MPSGLALGAAVSMAATIAISFIGAQLIMNEVIAQEQIGYCSLAALLTGTILGAVTSARKVKHRKLVVCLLSGGVYLLILLATTALIFGGQYEGLATTCLTVMIGSVAALLIQNRDGKQKNRRRRKK